CSACSTRWTSALSMYGFSMKSNTPFLSASTAIGMSPCPVRKITGLRTARAAMHLQPGRAEEEGDGIAHRLLVVHEMDRALQRSGRGIFKALGRIGGHVVSRDSSGAYVPLGSCAGRAKEKCAPPQGLVPASSVPWCASMMDMQIARPMPMPSA